MSAPSVRTLIIDSDFQKIIPPLQPKERELLEESLLSEGCSEPLYVWHGIIADGHHRYEICQKYQIPFSTTELMARNREEVIIWICTRQLGRRNLTEESRRYLIGMRYEMEKKIGSHNASGHNQYTQRDEDGSKICTEGQLQQEQIARVRDRLGEEYHMCPQTISNYGRFARAVNHISNVTPVLGSSILQGTVKMSQDRVVELSRSGESNIIQFESEIAARSGWSRYSDTRLVTIAKKLTRQKEPEHKSVPAEAAKQPSRTVKDAPADDPDQTASTLTLTIPSWISMINRALSQMNLCEVSDRAIQDLWIALAELQEATEKLMKIAEDSHDERK